MTGTLLGATRRRLLVIVLAAFLAIGASYAPVMLDSMVGTTLTPAVFACEHPGAGC